MHHKRGKAKNQRSGCLCCKRHKVNGFGKNRLDTFCHNFSILRDRYHAGRDLKEHKECNTSE